MSAFECAISQPSTVIDGETLTERNVSLLFSTELNYDHYDDLSPAEEKERLRTDGEVSFYEQKFLPHCNTA
jgi:hypothetical protein